MQIGNIIRKYRKERHMTQEEMARRLGVTTPAVNKWENHNSYPDISLLAPIARLLGISLDELLSYREELTNDEIIMLVQEADRRFEQDSYEETYRWIRQEMEEYPNCLQLIWQLAVLLDAHRLTDAVEEPDQYDDFILDCYVRVLESEEETLRTRAADSLFGYYIRKEEFDQAEKYLQYLSEQNPERKRKQAQIYSETGRTEEAYKAYEELLFSGYQILSMVMHGLYNLAAEAQNMEKARYYVEKQSALAALFEMGRYQEIVCRLDLAVQEKDEQKTREIQEQLIQNVDELMAFTESPLYEHMTFKKPDDTFVQKVISQLETQFQEQR